MENEYIEFYCLDSVQLTNPESAILTAIRSEPTAPTNTTI